MRRALLVVAGALAGVVLALAVTALTDEVYRADASIAIVRQGQPPGSDPTLERSAAAAAQLFESRAVAESAVANLRLDSSAEELLDRVDVSAEPGGSLVRIRVDAPSADEARRTAQELAEVSTVLFNDRFGPATVASIWEAPRAQPDPVSPRPGRNVLLGLAAGSLAGLGAILLAWPRRRAAPGRRPPAAGWSLADLERALAAGDPDPQRAEDRRLYLEALRDYADADGRIDAAFDELVDEVFGQTVAAGRR